MNSLTAAAQTIKDTVSAQDVGQALGLEMRRGRCKCPIHGGQDYNCVLYSGNRGYYCHVCKAGGDVISFVREYYSMSFKDSVSWINDTFRLNLDIQGRMTQEERRRAENAQRMRKNAIEHRQWKDRMEYGMALTASELLEKAEEIRDDHAPKTPDEKWDKEFCEAVRIIPAARDFAEDCWYGCAEKTVDVTKL